MKHQSMKLFTRQFKVAALLRPSILVVFILLKVIPSGAQNIAFQDTVFKQRVIAAGYDLNLDGEISLSEGALITSLNVNHLGSPGGPWWVQQRIRSLGGIEHFVNLDSLFCSNNQISRLDLSSNTKLSYLWASSTSLDTLILGNNDSLRYINLNQNTQCTDIDFTGLPNLRVLDYYGAGNVNMSGNPLLEELHCRFSQGAISVPNNPQLKVLECFNQASLDVSSCVGLKELFCEGRLIKLDSIDLTNNAQLVRLDLWNNNLTSIDLSQNVALEFVELGYNLIPSIDFTANTDIKYLSCGGDSLRSIDVTGLTFLESLATGNFLDSNSSQLEHLDVSTNVNLKELYCPAGNLTQLDLTQNPLLESLFCGYNNLDTLLLCANPVLSYLNCDGMPQLTHVFVPNPTAAPNFYSFGSDNWQFYNCALVLDVPAVASKTNLSLYPNPASDYFRFAGLPEDVAGMVYELRDLHGKRIMGDRLSEMAVNIEAMPAGLYVVSVYRANGLVFTAKLVK